MSAQNIFGKRLRELRKSREIKVKELCEVMYCSASLIYNLEKGYNQPQPDLIIRVATFFNVTTDFLLGIEQQRVVPSSGEELIKFYEQLGTESKIAIFKLLRLLVETRI